MIAAAIAAVAVGTASTSFAAANPFSDVPQGHWAYDAVSQLAKDGVIDGYGDGTFNGQKNITRYEMAQMVARAMAKRPAATNNDKALIDKLSAEFGDELNNLGVRVANLEKNSDNVKWSGGFQQKYQKSYQSYTKDASGHIVRNPVGNPWYEKEFDLNIAAKVPGTDWTTHAEIKTKWGSNGIDKGEGFNDERDCPDDWNGGNSRSNENRLDKIWVEGNLGKTGQYVKFGEFQPWTMNGFVNDGNIKGASAEHWGKNFATHIFGGRMDVKDWDMGMYVQPDYANGYSDPTNNYAWTAKGIQPYTDFVRKHDTTKFTCDSNGTWSGANGGTDFGGDNDYDAAGWKIKAHRKDIMGAVLDYTFSNKVNGSLGYYGFRSAAYHENWLHIGAGLLNYKLVRNLNLEMMYARGNQGGHNDAWNIELQFRGNPWIPTNRNHLFGAYLGYRYLGPDALIKSNFGDGADEGQKGWEAGMYYNIMKNCQYTLKYFNGKSITMNNEKRSKVFTSIGWYF